MKQRQRGVHITVHPDPGANIVVTELVCRDLQTQTLEADAVVVVHRALVLLTQDVRQVAADERYIGRAWHGAGYTNLLIVGGSVDLLEIPVGTIHVRDPGSLEFLGQSALVRLKRPLRASTRLGRVGRYVPDTELLERAAHFGQVHFVDLASRLGGSEVVAPPVAVQRSKQAIVGNGLADTVKARCGSLL